MFFYINKRKIIFNIIIDYKYKNNLLIFSCKIKILIFIRKTDHFYLKKIMENNLPPGQLTPTEETPSLNKWDKTYQLNFGNNNYKLSMNYDETNIVFRIDKSSAIQKYIYSNKYTLSELISKLYLIPEKYTTTKKLLELYQKYLDNNKVSLIYDEETSQMFLRLKKILDDEEIICDLELKKKFLSNNELISLLYEDVELLKSGKNGRSESFTEDPDFINTINDVKTELKIQNELMQNKHNEIVKEMRKEFSYEINQLKKEKDELKNKYENEIQNLKNQIKNITLQISNQNTSNNQITNQGKNNSFTNFIYDNSHKNLKCSEIFIPNNNECITPFCVFLPIQEQSEFLATYDCRKSKHLIDIYKIPNTTPIITLEGHTNEIRSIRYFANKFCGNDYLISSDLDKNVIIWDIFENYKNIRQLTQATLKYSDKGVILSTLLIFTAKDENFIITSSNNDSDDYTRVYKFEKTQKEKDECLKKLKNTNKNKTLYLLPWYYKDEWYIIELCYKKIEIINLEKNKEYAHLTRLFEEDNHIRGIIYKENYLCCSSTNGYVRVWDLVNKNLYTTIKINKDNLIGIIHWDYDIIIVANYTNNSLDVVSIDNAKLLQQIKTPHNCGVSNIEKVSCSSSKVRIISVSKDKALRFWSV